VHRDIKLENILIKSIEDKIEYEVRIADFGLAVFTPNNELLNQKCGTPGYVAPEVFMERVTATRRTCLVWDQYFSIC
jgi:serine/threonine protein kinase